MNEDTKFKLVIVSGCTAILVLLAFMGFAYVHDTAVVTVTEKEMSNGVAYVFASDGGYYVVPNLGIYGGMKVGHTYSVNTAVHVMGTPRNIDSAVEI